MRPGTDATILGILGAPKIVTAYCIRLDFQSSTIGVWTGHDAIQPTGSADELLTGMTFDPMVAGVMIDIGENSYSYAGSEEFTLSLAIPASPNVTIAAASVLPAEYQSRPATVWRALLYPQSDPLAQPIWLFRRIRTGAMDKVEITNDGQSHTFQLTIESHQSLISAANNSTYLDQEKFDPTDTSQRSAVAIANGDPAPSKGLPNRVDMGLIKVPTDIYLDHFAR
jgi:hypothetical protein